MDCSLDLPRSGAAAALCLLLVTGCSMPGKDKSPLASQIDGTKSVRTASYQRDDIDDGPPRKVDDPIALKLRYAKWMEEIENYNEAQAHYSVILQEHPKDIEAILGLARIAQISGKHADAEAGFEKALSLQPESPVAKNALGRYHVSRNQLQEAIPLLNSAVLAEPANKSYRFHLAVALAKSGDVNAAFPHFQQSVGEAPAHYNVGMILRSQGKYPQAERQFLEALSKNPEFEPARQAVTEVRQLAQAAGTYSTQAGQPQIKPAGHHQGSPLTPAQQEQLRNQRRLAQ